jgi:hypothetical protein
MPKLVNTGIQLQLHDFASKETIKWRTINSPGDGMGSSGLLDFTVHLVRLLLSICMPCVVSAFEKRNDIIVADRDINLLFKGLGILFTFYRSLFWPSYPLCMFAPLQVRPCLGSPRRRISKECDSELQENVRVIHALLDHIRTLKIAASLISAALCKAARICVRKLAKPRNT